MQDGKKRWERRQAVRVKEWDSRSSDRLRLRKGKKVGRNGDEEEIRGRINKKWEIISLNRWTRLSAGHPKGCVGGQGDTALMVLCKKVVSFFIYFVF